jgi:hypothetical protein
MLTVPSNQAPQLLSDEKRQVINFILMTHEQREQLLDFLESKEKTSGSLIAVLKYLSTT